MTQDREKATLLSKIESSLVPFNSNLECPKCGKRLWVHNYYRESMKCSEYESRIIEWLKAQSVCGYEVLMKVKS